MHTRSQPGRATARRTCPQPIPGAARLHPGPRALPRRSPSVKWGSESQDPPPRGAVQIAGIWDSAPSLAGRVLAAVICEGEVSSRSLAFVLLLGGPLEAWLLSFCEPGGHLVGRGCRWQGLARPKGAGGQGAGRSPVGISTAGARRSQHSRDQPSPPVSNNYRRPRSVLTGGGRNRCPQKTSGLLGQK